MTAFQIGRPRFVTKDEAMVFHALAIDAHGGSYGVLNEGLLESALAMPMQSFGGEYAHDYPFEMAAAYAFHLAKNHAFHDGNKRIALFCCDAFLRMNGWNLDTEGVKAADAILDLVENRMDKTRFAQWLATNCRARPSMELRDFFSQLRWDPFFQVFRSARPDSGGIRQAEFQASLDELVHVCPVVHGLLESNKNATRDGDETARLTCTGAILTLLTLHRLAEDMGYEW